MLSKEEIQNIATLARIGLKDEELEKYRKDLSDILEYFRELQKLDTEKVKEIGHITGVENVFRVDRAEDFGSVGRKDILKNCPDTKNGYIKVKSVL